MAPWRVRNRAVPIWGFWGQTQSSPLGFGGSQVVLGGAGGAAFEVQSGKGKGTGAEAKLAPGPGPRWGPQRRGPNYRCQPTVGARPGWGQRTRRPFLDAWAWARPRTRPSKGIPEAGHPGALGNEPRKDWPSPTPTAPNACAEGLGPRVSDPGLHQWPLGKAWAIWGQGFPGIQVHPGTPMVRAAFVRARLPGPNQGDPVPERRAKGHRPGRLEFGSSGWDLCRHGRHSAVAIVTNSPQAMGSMGHGGPGTALAACPVARCTTQGQPALSPWGQTPLPGPIPMVAPRLGGTGSGRQGKLGFPTPGGTGHKPVRTIQTLQGFANWPTGASLHGFNRPQHGTKGNRKG